MGPFSQALPKAKLNHLVRICTEQVFAKGERVLVEGAVAHSLFFLLEGRAVATKQGAEVLDEIVQKYSSSKGAGPCHMGEMVTAKGQLAGQLRYGCTVTATQKRTRCLRLGYDQIEATIAAGTAGPSPRQPSIDRYAITDEQVKKFDPTLPPHLLAPPTRRQTLT